MTSCGLTLGESGRRVIMTVSKAIAHNKRHR